MKKNCKKLLVLALGAVIVSYAGAQTPAAGTTDGIAQPSQTLPAASPGSPANSTDGAYATGKPLAGQSKEGFWGKVNPFARKKWVNRQVDPIKDRTNELDQLQAKNANDIRDVDTRSQAGINKAINSANVADQHAADARSRADTAQGVATSASNKTTLLNGTVSGLDQYQTVTTVPLAFAAGRTTLGPKGKGQLDDLSIKLALEKGYIIEVQGFSRNGLQASQAMADSVVRYLVVEHQLPMYRIYRTGLGKNTQKTVSGDKPMTNGVVVSLMHNSLATLNSANASATPGSGSPNAPNGSSTSNVNGATSGNGVAKPTTN